MTTRSKFALALLGLVVLALYSSWGRPLWLDEYLHFAFGGFGSWGEAWAAVQSSTTNINHGQTGFYLLLDYGLLQVFGANLFAMRLPSILSGALLLFSAALFLRRMGLGGFAIAAAFLLFAAQPNLMYFVGEARPYMPLVGASVAALAYFSSSAEERRTPFMRVFIWSTMIWGALMMPYYVVYLPILAVTMFFIRREPRTWHRFFTFINVPIQVTSAILGIGISALTWLRGSPDFQRDPWLIVRPLLDSLSAAHIAGLMVVAALVVATFWLSRNDPRGPLTLFIVMGVVAALLALLSYLQSYWILPRQFVASQAIMTLAIVWGVGLALKNCPSAPKRVLSAIFAVLILVVAGRAGAQQVERLLDWENNGYPAAGNPGAAEFHGIDVGPANQNVTDGGSVWPQFADLYDEPRYAPGEEPRSP